MVFIKILAIVVLLALSNLSLAEDYQLDDHWWSGFSITPGAGFRHLGFDVVRKSDGFTGNISNNGFAQAVTTLSMTSPSFKLNQSGTIVLEIQSYTALLELDHQFYADGGVGPAGGNSGERVNVGTTIDGYYSYVVPAIKFNSDVFTMSLGVGYWVSGFTGDIILSQNDRPSASMPKTSIDMSDRKELAYLFTMSWISENKWIALMSIGGTKFNDSTYDYSVEEVAFIFGKQFVF
jgi:hypothetical protein